MAVTYNPPEWTSGDDESLTFTKTAGGVLVNLNGYSGRMQIRASDNSLILESIGDIDALTSEITFRFSNSSTEIFRTLGSGPFRYDVELVSPSGILKTELKGVITVDLDVTREGVAVTRASTRADFISKIGVRPVRR